MMAMQLRKFGLNAAASTLGATLALCLVSAVFGMVTENDVRRLTMTVDAGRFFNPLPGSIFEVVEENGSALRLCNYANATATESISRGEIQHNQYYNLIGRTVPVGELAEVVGAEQFRLQVELDWHAYSEALRDEFEAAIGPNCETKAQQAYQRGSIVCVVDAVVRSAENGQIVAVRFNPWGFTPQGVNIFPRCPVMLPTDVFWPIRRPFISVASGHPAVDGPAEG
jgi:hypothetical protein